MSFDLDLWYTGSLWPTLCRDGMSRS